MGGLSQTDKLFAAILVGFLVFITVKGQLPAYANLFVASPPVNPPAATTKKSSFWSQLGDYVEQNAQQGAQVLAAS